uniref:Sugar transporter ST3 n=1 Tax=Toxoplasma gondii COUG TaxID=1074873 RepID=A0A2G8XXT7_TOXGO|nr:sugar transporter ST3 [Toxoplasma gondii COUG]
MMRPTCGTHPLGPSHEAETQGSEHGDSDGDCPTSPKQNTETLEERGNRLPHVSPPRPLRYIGQKRNSDPGDRDLSGWSLPSDVTAVGVATEEEAGSGKEKETANELFGKKAQPSFLVEGETYDLHLTQRLIVSVCVVGIVFALAGFESTSPCPTIQNEGVDLSVFCSAGDSRRGCVIQHLFLLLFLVGLAVGCVFGGLFGDCWGRRRVFFFTDIFAVTGSALVASARNYVMLLCGRTLVGVAIGSGFVAYGAYVAEISPPESRGALLAMSQVFFILGRLSSFAVLSTMQESAWRYLAGIAAAIAGGQFLLLLFYVPESPKWMIQKQKPAKALSALKALGEQESHAGAIIMQQEQRIPEQVIRQAHRYCPETCSLLLVTHGRQFLTALGCAFFAVVVGSSFVGQLHNASIAQTVACDTRLVSIATGAAKGLGVLIALLVVDSWGRRPLLLTGTVTAGVAFSLMAIDFLWHNQLANDSVRSTGTKILTPCSGRGAEAGSMPSTDIRAVGLILAVFGQNLGWSTLFLGVVAEMLPTCVRGLALGFTLFLYFLLDACTSFLMDSTLLKVAPSSTLTGYTALSVVAFFFTFIVIPEGRGCALDRLTPDGYAPSWLNELRACSRRGTEKDACGTGRVRRGRGLGSKMISSRETGIEMQSQTEENSPTISQEASVMQAVALSDAMSLQRDIQEAIRELPS